MPNEEYDIIGPFAGFIISSFRASLGDFDFEAQQYLTTGENYLYWFIWILMIVILTIVFLNFIIAETSASYEKVKSRLDAMIFKEKASMISEAEGMLFEDSRNAANFPKYIIIRTVDT